jgi:hypothetical protein
VEVETKETDLTEFLKTLKIVDNIKVRKQSPVPIIPAKTTALVEVEEPEKTKEAAPAQGTPAGQTPEEKKVYLIMLVDQEDRIDLSKIKIIDSLLPPPTKHVTALVLVDDQDIDLSKIKIIDSLPPIKIDLPLLEIIDKLPKLARGEATRAPVTPTLKEMEELLKETSSGGNTTNTTKPFKKHKTIKAQVPPPPPQTVLEIVRESLDKMISKYSPRVKAFWKKCKTAMMPTQEEIDRYNARIEELIVQNSLIEKLREEERKNDTPKNQRDDL